MKNAQMCVSVKITETAAQRRPKEQIQREKERPANEKLIH